MKGLLKVLIGLFGLLVVLIIAAAVIVPMYFDPNDYRDEISAMVKKQTGRDLQIEGELQISVFPWLGIQTGRIVLGNAEGFGNEPFAEAEEIQARVKLLPLLRKEIEMDTVVIDRLRANLIRNKDGVTNWDDLVKAQEEEVAQTDADIEAQKTTSADADQPPPIAALALGGLDIRDSR
ncbi:MAG: AsmA family protein, partial [Gammaproteobacteria bacterium]